MNIEGSNVKCLGVTLSTIATKGNTAVPREHKVCQFAEWPEATESSFLARENCQ